MTKSADFYDKIPDFNDKNFGKYNKAQLIYKLAATLDEYTKIEQMLK